MNQAAFDAPLLADRSEKPSVLFVSNTSRGKRPYVDPSSRYRSYNISASLASKGHRTLFIAQKAFDENIEVADEFDYVHFHRPRLGEANVDFFCKNSKSNRIIADFDDGTIRVDQAEMTPAVRFYDVPLRKVAHDIACMAEACTFFDKFTLSTQPLSDQVAAMFRPRLNKVVSNGLDPAYLGIARLIRTRHADRPRPYRIGYFPGTASHNGDFASIAEPLAETFAAHRDLQMLLVGPVEIPEALLPFAGRIVQRGLVPFHHLPHTMALCDTVLAPLERTPFTNAKSGIKFFEAAVVGCSVIATPIPDIDRFESPLLLKADSADAWRWSFKEVLARTLSPEEREAAAREVEESVATERIYRSWVSDVLA